MRTLSTIAVFSSLVFFGCAGTVSETWVEENRDFHNSVVKGVLLPHYLDENPSPPSQAEIENITAAIAEHEQRLNEWEN